MKQSLLLRADASTQSGAGHIMRCFALTQAWQLEGGRNVFLSRCESDALRERVTDAGMEFIPIANPHPGPRDLQTTLEILRLAYVSSAVTALRLTPGSAKPPVHGSMKWWT